MQCRYLLDLKDSHEANKSVRQGCNRRGVSELLVILELCFDKAFLL